MRVKLNIPLYILNDPFWKWVKYNVCILPLPTFYSGFKWTIMYKTRCIINYREVDGYFCSSYICSLKRLVVGYPSQDRHNTWTPT